MDETAKFTVKGTARFVIGGALADSGFRGRRTVVDSYGGV
jgi:S-adenosylmethionine synthetase